jgi:hypothetical protein
MNPIIIIAIVAQAFISRTSRMAGAIVGYIVTAGILLWGLSLYSQGSGIIFFAIPLSEGAFIAICALWFAFDTRAFLRARKYSARPVQYTGPVEK